MPPQDYDRLTALDNSFLLLEGPSAYMHVASTAIFDAGPLRSSSGGIRAEEIRRLTEASLHRIPRYRQKLAWIPFQQRAVWRDDDDFNLDYHFRHTSLPKPGTDEQLKRLSARIMQQHLDRDRPLWEMWVVEGLEGDRFALISKVHHCMIDGVSGVDLMNILMSIDPQQEIPTPPGFEPRPAPGSLQLLRDEWTRRFSLPGEIFRDAQGFFREAEDTRQELSVRARALFETLGGTLRQVSQTPFNRPIGPHRRFDWLAFELADVKEVRRELGGSLNDIVLAIVAGAVRQFLERRRVDPSEILFRIMAPVSVRSDQETGTLGNRVSAWIAELPIGEPDPRERLAIIRERTLELKASKQAVAAEMLTRVADWSSSTLLALGARTATRMLPFNMVVTNVPGPQVPLYSLGARMLEVFPHVPLADNLGLGVALMSYDGKLFWGFNADYDLVPDLDHFVRAIQSSFEEMRECCEAMEASVPDSGDAPPLPDAAAPPPEPV